MGSNNLPFLHPSYKKYLVLGVDVGQQNSVLQVEVTGKKTLFNEGAHWIFIPSTDIISSNI